MRARLRFLVVSCGVAACGVAACANLLGIDDGIPRGVDASLDATQGGPDAGADASDAGFSLLHCGSTNCNVSIGEGCCYVVDAGFTCVATVATCTGAFIPCDRPEQCPQGDAGPVECCGSYTLTDAGAITTNASCALKSQCTLANNRFIICDDDSGADCIPDASCGVSTFTLPTFLICK